MLIIRIKNLILLFFLSLGLIFILYIWSIRKSRSEFVRVFPPHMLRNEKQINLKFNSYYFAGKSTQSIYLGNFTTPSFVTELDVISEKLRHYRLQLPNSGLLKTGSFHLSVDSAYFYLTNGNNLIYKSERPSLELRLASGHPFPNFFDFCQLSGESCFLRTYNPDQDVSTLSKLLYNPYLLKETAGILEKQVDGLFDTDGMMQYDQTTQKLIYVYFYRNQFIVMDSNLNLLYKGNTIDSNTTVKFKVASFNQQRTTVIAAPGRINNKRIRSYRGMIFIQSGLISSNEQPDILERYAVVDVYALNDGHYRFSFYIPRKEGKTLNDFIITQDRLVSICGNMLYSYDFNLPPLR